MTLSDITVIYLGKYDIYCPSNYYHEQPTPYAADINSKFKIVRDLKYAYYHNERLPLRPIVTSETYYIDDIVVDEKTWNDVFKTMSKRIQNVTGSKPKYSIINDTDDTTTIQYIPDDLRGKRADCAYMDGHMYVRIGDYASLYSKNIKKENEDMPKIVDYKYNEETGTTTLFWADKTQTTVTADNLTEANQFEGFCAACAKKLFGNKSTYLNQFDKWAVKKPEQERKKAEAEKAKAEEQAKIEAERAERAKARKIKRLAKKWVNDYKTANERLEIYEAAEKLAKEKYGVPDEYFADDCDCHCNCKEFDVMDEDENNISD